MTSSEHGWQEVADNFTALGRRLRERVKDEGAADGTAGAQPDAETTSALKQFTEAAERLGDRLNATVKDDEVRHGAQQAVRSLGDAMKTTFEELSQDLRGLIDRRRGEGGGASDTAEQPPTGPTALPPTPPPSDPVTGGGGSTPTDGAP